MNDYTSGEGLSEDDEQVNQLASQVDKLALFTTISDPVCFEDANKELRWRRAMDQEMEAIKKNETWELCSLPKGAKAIGVKWIYKTKLNAHGEVDKCKERLVAKGYAQEYGIDYTEVFAPVARWDTIRSIIALAAQKGYKIFHLDVKSAFLHGEITETMYVSQPQGYEKHGSEDKVYRLKRPCMDSSKRLVLGIVG